jgi:hypothetical protein
LARAKGMRLPPRIATLIVNSGKSDSLIKAFH